MSNLPNMNATFMKMVGNVMEGKKKNHFQHALLRKPAATQWEFEPRGLLRVALLASRPCWARSWTLLWPGAALAFVQHKQSRALDGADREATGSRAASSRPLHGAFQGSEMPWNSPTSPGLPCCWGARAGPGRGHTEGARGHPQLCQAPQPGRVEAQENRRRLRHETQLPPDYEAPREGRLAEARWPQRKVQ